MSYLPNDFIFIRDEPFETIFVKWIAWVATLVILLYVLKCLYMGMYHRDLEKSLCDVEGDVGRGLEGMLDVQSDTLSRMRAE